MTEPSNSIMASGYLSSRVVEDVLHHSTLPNHVKNLVLKIINGSSICSMHMIMHLLVCMSTLLMMMPASHLWSIHHVVLNLRHPHSVAMSYFSSSELSQVYQWLFVRNEIV